VDRAARGRVVVVECGRSSTARCEHPHIHQGAVLDVA
jgi:hypothetical protein